MQRLLDWGGYLGDAALTMAILDRMIQRATRMEIEGPSWRDKESKELNERRRADAHSKRKPQAGAKAAALTSRKYWTCPGRPVAWSKFFHACSHGRGNGTCSASRRDVRFRPVAGAQRPHQRSRARGMS